MDRKTILDNFNSKTDWTINDRNKLQNKSINTYTEMYNRLNDSYYLKMIDKCNSNH